MYKIVLKYGGTIVSPKGLNIVYHRNKTSFPKWECDTVGKIVTHDKTFNIPPLRTVDYAPAKAIKVLSIGVLFRTLPL